MTARGGASCAHLKDMRNRIASTKATQKITKAMQMVAASKLRRAQAAAEAARPYAERMETVLGNIAAGVAGLDSAPKLLAGTGSDQVHLLVVCTAERGLCGAFNSSIVRLARERANALAARRQRGQVPLRRPQGLRPAAPPVRAADHRDDRVARRAPDRLRQRAGDRRQDHSTCSTRGAFDVCTLFFSRFRSVIAQIPTAQQIIPAVSPQQRPKARPRAAYEYEPDEEDILAELLPRYVATQVYRALLENAASEQGARMSAMDNATRNAGEMIRKQTLTYNRTRQAMITKELIEIISGAEAL